MESFTHDARVVITMTRKNARARPRLALVFGCTFLVFLGVALGGCTRDVWWHRHELVTEEEAGRALEWAMTQLDAPYLWGGREPPAFDSSGIITWSYRQALGELRLRYGSLVVHDLPHRDIYRWNFERLPLEALRPGDLVYITNGTAEVTHGAMFVRWVEPYSLMEFLDASTTQQKVVIQAWPVDEEVRGQRFVAAGRLKVVR